MREGVIIIRSLTLAIMVDGKPQLRILGVEPQVVVQWTRWTRPPPPQMDVLQPIVDPEPNGLPTSVGAVVAECLTEASAQRPAASPAELRALLNILWSCTVAGEYSRTVDQDDGADDGAE